MSERGSARQGICILGATGSIGASTLDVLARHPERFRVVALTANSKVEQLVDLCRRFQPELAAIGEAGQTAALAEALRAAGLRTAAVGGADGLVQAVRLAGVDTVVAAIVGAAGLNATLAAARAGRRLLLANKEAIVCAGARDASHAVRRLILTASGGPFLRRTDLAGVTPEQACAHPKWNMGRKISVDSATLMNKGLEVIEASWLFGFEPDRIDVVIHPQSVVHSMVEFVDGSVLAQMGTPDMRTPIAYALGFPERIASGSPWLDLLQAGPLQFEPPNQDQFPCLGLAYQALRAGSAACITLNAANEVAVDSFLQRELPFARIPAVIQEVLAGFKAAAPDSIEAVVELDRAARRQARSVLTKSTCTY
jgi:1-deoxy-D-xylulose-5-phosphate reductoisomerase